MKSGLIGQGHPRALARAWRPLLTCCMVAIGAFAGAIVQSGTAGAAAPTTLYVAHGGSDSGSCSATSPCATIAYAITQAGPNPTIQISGTVSGNVSIATPLTITGAQAPPGVPLCSAGQAAAPSL